MLLSMHKKGQVWSLDLLVAFIIFTVSLGVIYFYALNYTAGSSDDLSELFYEGDLASNLLLSEWEQWNFGLLEDGKIVQGRLEDFDSRLPEEKKTRVGVSNNFYFSMPGMKISGVPQEYVGIVNVTSVDSQVKITRIVIYENKPTKFELIIWK
ncbi:MAG: hypothetical protein HQ521_03495 [Bacteroidetes bacterium]|nr:hypothetical protein [Bacteroidota bacterium]